MRWLFLFFGFVLMFSGRVEAAVARRVVGLNGLWDVTKTEAFELLPQSFGSRIQVPGLVDMATPALDSARLYDSGVYWYRRSITINESYPELVRLRLGKAKYHAKVYVNGHFVGEHLYCFTPAEFSIRRFLNRPGEPNELLIGVGTRYQMPDSVIWGKDSEKCTYIPGIYDDVSLVMSGSPFIEHIQVVPFIDKGQIRVVASLSYATGRPDSSVQFRVKELASGKVVAKGRAKATDFFIPLPGCRLWTPEDPFLYELELSTAADVKKVRFGMRSFGFDSSTGRAMLNGKPYYMRGTNVCILRFFEDPERGNLPWDDSWVIKLHTQFKEMHWNSMRYCIGLPPDRWYDIADSLGFLIQNEYPIWTGGGKFENTYPGVQARHIAGEFRSWLPLHWNHPSVVIWDAQNESVAPLTEEAIRMVRAMDLSNRPWENGWSAPLLPTDPIETHPYFFMRFRRGGAPTERGALADFLTEAHIPGNDVNEHNPRKDGVRYNNPMIINEYAWLWLNRDGSTTTLTDRVYDVVFGKGLTTERRVYLYSRYLGMLTEYWRAHRLCAGVLHFCGLGYSRPTAPRGQTSDHYIDIKNLVWEPQFINYVKPSFAPVGLMIDFWEKRIAPEQQLSFRLYAINDLYTLWSGEITCSLEGPTGEVSHETIMAEVAPLGRTILPFSFPIPAAKGAYTLTARINFNGEIVRSIREFDVE